jgi:hypothetical protein
MVRREISVGSVPELLQWMGRRGVDEDQGRFGGPRAKVSNNTNFGSCVDFDWSANCSFFFLRTSS